MRNDQKRYSGSALPQRAYRKEFLVECPKCKREALVEVDNPFYLNNGRLHCFNCFFSMLVKDIIRYQVSVKRTCDNCGKTVSKITSNNKSKLSSVEVTCNSCGIKRICKPRNEEYRMVKNNLLPHDPIFHNTLWLQCLIKGELFWAYNKKQLLEIRKYVEATLRERETNDYTTMVEKLPSFIKQAKNRHLIIKAIDRLLVK
jgi:DNA-directed RNA polymerase subunit RPC12/RpoP